MKLISGLRGVLTLFLISFSMNMFADQMAAESMYELISKANLRSLPKKEEKKRSDESLSITTVNDPYAFYEQQKEENFKPSPYDIRQQAFGLLQKADKNGVSRLATPIIDTTTWGDLNLLSGSEKHPEIYLGKIIDRTSTEIGRAYFLSQLAQPTDDLAVLTQRQELARYWVNFPKEAAMVDGILTSMVQGEAQMLLFGKSFGILQAVRDNYCQYSLLGPINDAMNNDETFLDIVSGVNKTFLYPDAAYHVALSLFFISFAVLKFHSQITGDGKLYKTPEDKELSLKMFNPFGAEFEPKEVKGTFVRQADSSFSMDGISWRVLANIFPCLAGFIALKIAGKIIFTADDYLKTKHLSSLWMKLLHEKIRHLACYVKQMRRIYTMASARPDLQKRLRYFNQIHAFFTSQDKDLQHLLSILETATFDGPAEFFFHEGRVLVAYKLLLEQPIQNQFACAAMSIAEIDASLSVAKLVNEFKDQPVRYSFVDFTQTATPCVDIGEFWNPFVDPNVVVPNTLKLGADFNCANIVVTGPNSGGKSTVLKSIALALVMGQSLGIAPAAKASMTPFHYVATYMGITDDITDKASLHQAEVDRATRMASMIDHMPRDQFSFVMFDELFNGTNPNEGTSLAYATAEVLGKMPHCVSIIASHYPYITMLESKTGRHKNYRVSVDETRDVIKRHYKLEPGISHQQIGIKVARERGCSGAIIDRAEEVLEELKNQKK